MPQRPPFLEIHAPVGTDPPRWSAAATWIVIAAAALVLLWIAFRLHVVGDYHTESDFYGGYAEGARLIQRGRPDPARYPVVGPGYDAALALVGFVVRDLFTAARLISVAAAVGTLILWRSLLARRAGADVALWTVAFVAANPVFLRYGFSATTDMLAIVLQAAALHAMLAPRGGLAPLRAGLFAALATLTRYNSIYLVPAGIAAALWLAPPADRSRTRAVLAQLGGFALISGPWVAFSLASGHVPGASLFGKFSTFYMIGDASRNVQDQFAAVADSLATARSLGRVLAHDPAGLVLEVLRHVPDHLRREATELLGWPVAALCLAGLAFVPFDGLWRRLLPVWAAGGLLFATLVPIFYSDRYSMAIAPAYLTLAAAAAASRRFALRLRPGGLPLKWLLALVPLVLSVREDLVYERNVLSTMPVEVLEAGRVLAREAAPGDRVMSRKAQIAYYSGCAPVPFPRLGTLAELGEYCREREVRFLYYSWYEAWIRPEFVFLLDTSAAVPGLEALLHTSRNPSTLYRVGPDFGREPEWFPDRAQRRLHLARAQVQFMPDTQAAPSHLLLAIHAFDAGKPVEALGQVEAALRGRPRDATAWRVAGEALREMGRLPEAIRAYERALALDPRDLFARLGLGWAQLGNGSEPLAAGAWRSAIGPATDVTTLRQMVEIFDRVGDHRSADAARAELAARGAERR